MRNTFTHQGRFSIALSICAFLLLPCVSAQDNQKPKIAAPPFVYSTKTIKSARETAKRAGWTEAVIENQFDATDDPAERLWRQAVKTAFFPTPENRDECLAQFRSLHENLANLDGFQAMNVFQSYDCLSAIDDEIKLDATARQELEAAVQALLDQTIGAESPYPLLKSALLAYGSMLAGNDALHQQSLAGDGEHPGLIQTLRNDPTSEGLTSPIPIEIQFTIYDAVYQAGLATQRHSPTEALLGNPWLSRFADTITELLWFDVHDPSSPLFSPGTFAAATGCLERAALLWKNDLAFQVLAKAYSIKPRLPDALLLTGQPISTKAAELRSTAFPRIGAAILHDKTQPSTIALNTGFQPASLLTLQNAADSRGILAGVNPDSPRFENTVYINRQPHIQANAAGQKSSLGLISSFASFPSGGAYIAALAGGQFGERAAYSQDMPNPVPVFEREAYVCGPYIVDLFRVQSNGVQDWHYSLDGTLKTSNSADWKPFQATPEDDAFLKDAKNVKTKDAKGVYSITLAPKRQPDIAERLWFVDAMGSEAITAEFENRTTVIQRRPFSQMTGNLFAVVHETIASASDTSAAIEKLALNPQPNERDFQAIAFAAQLGNTHDIFLSATRPDIEYKTNYLDQEIAFKGKFAHIRIKEKRVTLMRLIGGTALRCGWFELTMPLAMSTGILHDFDESAGTAQAMFSAPLPFGGALRGQFLNVVNPNPDGVFLQPLPIGSIEGLQDSQTIRLLHAMNLANPSPLTASPIVKGSQALFQYFAELRDEGGEIFSLTHSSEIGVSIQGPPYGNRVVMLSNKIRKSRGELDEKRIRFTIRPEELLSGVVQLKRIQ